MLNNSLNNFEKVAHIACLYSCSYLKSCRHLSRHIHDCEMFNYQSSLEWAVPVSVTLCLCLLHCACPCWSVPVFYPVPVDVGMCLSYGYAVPVWVGLCLSLLPCACLCCTMPVFVTLCLSVLCCTFHCYTVPVHVGLCQLYNKLFCD